MIRSPRRAPLLAVATTLAMSGIATAQSAPPASDAAIGYAEVVAHSAFGNVTSQSYGGEVGYKVWKTAQLFVEGGAVGDVASSATSGGAQAIAGALTQLQPEAVSYSVKQPVAFVAAGLRHPFAVHARVLRPYVAGAFGAARVKNDVHFRLGGVDSPDKLAQYVTLGSDLSGTTTSALMNLGGGVEWLAWHRLVLDFQYRYGRIFHDGGGINVHRAGLGVGVTF